ncbi:MBL fold metallo-hydrolase [candidate division WOR-3 bacterium]|nr:MBL fold metallo-hydrolase [candidate division WOR-3 bacterium]
MFLKRFVLGPIETNCYLVADETIRDAVIIDPDIRTRQEKEEVTGEIGRQKLSLKRVINTHHHSDHIGGNRMLKETYGAGILIHELDAPVAREPWKWWQKTMRADPMHPCPGCGHQENYLNVFEEEGKAVLGCKACGFSIEILSSPPADRLLCHGDVINVGRMEFRVIHTPGHTPGGMCLYVKEEKAIFTGDTLLNLSVGRTDTIDGSHEDILKSARSLMELPDETIVYPGHGDQTTIGREKRENPYVR